MTRRREAAIRARPPPAPPAEALLLEEARARRGCGAAPACCCRCARAARRPARCCWRRAAPDTLHDARTCASCRCSPGGWRSRSTTPRLLTAERQLEALVGAHRGRRHGASTPAGRIVMANAAAARLMQARLGRAAARDADGASCGSASRSTTPTAGRSPTGRLAWLRAREDERKPPPLLVRRVDRATGDQRWLLVQVLDRCTTTATARRWRCTSPRTSRPSSAPSSASGCSSRRAGCSARRSTSTRALQEVARADGPRAGRLVRDRPARAGRARPAGRASPTSSRPRSRSRVACARATRSTLDDDGAVRRRDPHRRAACGSTTSARDCCARPPSTTSTSSCSRRSASPRCWSCRCARATTCSARSRSSPRSRTGASTTPTRRSRRRSRSAIADALRNARLLRDRAEIANVLSAGLRPESVAGAARLRGRGRLPARRRGRAGRRRLLRRDRRAGGLDRRDGRRGRQGRARRGAQRASRA